MRIHDIYFSAWRFNYCTIHIQNKPTKQWCVVGRERHLKSAHLKMPNKRAFSFFRQQNIFSPWHPLTLT